MNERFSKRIGINVIPTEIAIRYDAPEDFRKYLFFVMQKYGHGLKKLREVVCLAAKLAPNSNNSNTSVNTFFTFFNSLFTSIRTA